jgi:hypothetical protein
MNTPLQNLIAITFLFGPFILVIIWYAWFELTGRGAAFRERRREREIEIAMRLGAADAARMDRVARRIAHDGRQE